MLQEQRRIRAISLEAAWDAKADPELPEQCPRPVATHRPPRLHLLLSSLWGPDPTLGDLLLFNRSVIGRSSLGADLPGAAAGGQVSCSGSPLGLFLRLAPPETNFYVRSRKKKKKKQQLKSWLVIKSHPGSGGDYEKRNQNQKGFVCFFKWRQESV